MIRKYKYFVGDFETTVYEEQDHTEVWASAVVELFTEDVKIFHSIDETFNYFVSLDDNICVYYHNLKFDGAFWLSYLMLDKGFRQAATEIRTDKTFDVTFVDKNKMKNKTFQYNISYMGQWYNIVIKINNHYIEIRDSLKLLPFSVKRIGQSFGTLHKKLDMEYTGFRYAGCTITDEEQKYIANDVLVVKEALEIMFTEGHTNLTIGACCLSEYKKLIGKEEYETLFPDVYDIKIDKNIYGYDNAGDYIRKSYRGGWCYLVKGKEVQKKYDGITADVNSLYPSMMSSESCNYYPVGKPTFWHGDYIPFEAQGENKYYFVRIRTRFYIKENYLPCIQIKGNVFYNGTEWLFSSDIFSKKDGKFYSFYKDIDGNIQPAKVTLTLTMTDYKLIQEHYHLVDCEILDGCWFYSEKGIFDRYIEKYKKIKIESKGAKRELAKLFLNNLYGKMAASKCSSFKYAYIDNGVVKFVEINANDKKAGYIPVGSAITSYARNFTIRAAQKNYYGENERGFIYADTDSIHCDLTPKELKGITVHPKNFCCWKLESSWDYAFFTRQKTYIEHIVAEDLEPVEQPYFSIKCAGMPERCKELLRKSMMGLSQKQWEELYPEEWGELTPEQKEFVLQTRTIEDFKSGLKVYGKLLPKRINGGIVLYETTFEMK